MNSDAVRPDWRKIERSVPGANSRCSGTITVRSARRSFTWLPLWLTRVNPALVRAATTSAPRQLEALDSRRELDGGDDRRFDAFRKHLVLEIQFKSFAKIG